MLILHTTLLVAQEPFHSSINTKQGLPSNSVYCIFQDSKGFMWFATNEGICRYDGFEFKSYYTRQQISKSGSQIKEDKFGRIWYQNFDGYLYYVQNDSLHVLIQNKPIGYFEYALINEHLLVLQKNGIDIYNLNSLKIEKTISLNLLPLSYTMQLGNKYAVFLNKIILFDENGNLCKDQTYLGEIKTFDNFPTYSSTLKGTHYFINTREKNKVCYSMVQKQSKVRFKVENKEFIQNMCATKDKLWFCTPSGVLCYDTIGKIQGEENGWFKGKNINCVYQSKDNCFWIGTASEGILFVRDFNTRVLSLSGAAPSRIEKLNGNLIVGTKSGQILLVDVKKNSFTKLNTNEDNHPVQQLKLNGEKNTLYYTTNTFNKFSLVAKNEVRWTIAVKDIELLNNGYIAVAASGFVGLLRPKEGTIDDDWDKVFTKATLTNSNSELGQILSYVRAKSITKFDDESNFYCATNTGLFKITPNGNTEIKYNGTSIYFSKIEAKSSYIVGLTTSGNLLKLNKEGGINAVDESGTIKNMFLCDSILCLFQESKLVFYKMNEKGLEKCDYKFDFSGEQIYDATLLNDKLMLAYDGGLMEINLRKLSKLKYSDSFVINSIKVNGEPRNWQLVNKLDFTENDLSINYSIIDYINSSEQKLFYRINSEEWRLLPYNTRNLNLAALSSGEYKLEFKLNDKILNDKISFVIATPWWKQTWFIVFAFLLMGSLIVVYYRWQTSVLKKKNLLLVQKIELEKNLNQSMLTSIKAQMNPHFFYNALNTIQSYIFSDDKRNAANYLSKFSKLTRIILEMSEKEFILLSEEINALTLYLELEKVRFSGDFEFTIDIKEGVDLELTKIPSMIIQPFIENAVKHGLLHKKGEKILTITFEREQNILKVNISDNGIGRKKADELNKIKNDKHQSFSTTANSKRLEILNEGSNKKVGIEIVDQYTEIGEASGTSVHIKIPI